MEKKHEDEVFSNIRKGMYSSPNEIPSHAWLFSKWDELSYSDAVNYFEPFLDSIIQDGKQLMPDIYHAYSKNLKIKTIDDFYRLPILVKDASMGTVGFRHHVAKNPHSMCPKNVKHSFVFKSGGTKGVATPTFITKNDREIESYGLARCFLAMGMKKGDVMLSTYNPTHKGGEIIKECASVLEMELIPRRTTDTVKEVIRDIQNYSVNVLATVQGPLAEGDNTKKGGGVDFVGLITEGQDILEEKVDTFFVTGYKLIDEVINWAVAYKKNLATTLGSSEAIPQATSTIGSSSRICKHNNMHLIYGPHFPEVVKYESGSMVPVKKNETGILLYTTLAREGTRYIRYAPGDSVKYLGISDCPCGRKTPLITDISRIDIPNEIVLNGCCIG